MEAIGNNDRKAASQMAIKKITCIGSGFVGGPTSAVTAFKSTIDVTVVDINAERIAAWQSDRLPIYEPGLFDIVCAARDGKTSGDKNGKGLYRQNLFFSTDIDRAIEQADLIFVCVNTPTKNNGIGRGTAPDIGFVETATRNIARVATQNKIVVEKSTVPCRTAQSIREILAANARPGVSFEVLSNPEFLAEGTAVRDLLNPDRIIIGSVTTSSGFRAAAALVEVYAQWVPRERIITMNLWSSELSKLAANAMLAQRISSVNALSAICEVTGADVNEVSHACGLDSRIGPQMLKAGPGFGGSCFQKDIFNIVYLSESLHLKEVADYWRAIIEMNEYQKKRFTQRVITCLYNNLAGKKIAVLGFAFKKDTSDTRDSPAITLVTNFVAERAHVAIFDPQVPEQQIWRELTNAGTSLEALKQYVSVCPSAYVACDTADAAIVVTEWEEFSNKLLPISLPTLETRPPLAEVSMNRSLQHSAKASHVKVVDPSDMSFQLPPKRRTGIVIRDPCSGEVKTFEPQRSFTAPLHPGLANVSYPQTAEQQISGAAAHAHAHAQRPAKTSNASLPLSLPLITHNRAPIESLQRSFVDGTGLSLQRLGKHPETVDMPAKSSPPERLDWVRIAKSMRKPMYVFDSRSILDHAKLEELGFRVEAIGKASPLARHLHD